MLKNIAKKEIKENLWKLIIGMVFLTVPIFLIIFGYDLIIELTTNPSIEQFERFMPEMTLFYDDTSYIWSQWNAKNLYQIGSVIAIILAMSQIAGEVSSNTIGFLLSKPVPRKKVYYTKAFAGIILLSITVILTTALLLILGYLFFDDLLIYPLLIASIISLIGLYLIYSLSLFFSTIIDDPIKAGITTAIIVIASSIPGWFQTTRRFSLSTYIKGEDYILNNQFPYLAILIIIVITILIIGIGANIFEKKEF
ncbi:ABC transporter permease [Natronospora cellulosivora (SeqCode)]